MREGVSQTNIRVAGKHELADSIQTTWNISYTICNRQYGFTCFMDLTALTTWVVANGKPLYSWPITANDSLDPQQSYAAHRGLAWPSNQQQQAFLSTRGLCSGSEESWFQLLQHHSNDQLLEICTCYANSCDSQLVTAICHLAVSM